MDTTEKKKSRDFNIYYLNFSKVYEIAMMINNVILTKIETDKSSSFEEQYGFTSSISAQGTKQFLDGIKASISADARETSTSSSKVVESLDVKTTKSILLRRIIEQCASVTLLDNSVEGDLVKVDRVKLELLNEESLRQFLKRTQPEPFSSRSLPWKARQPSRQLFQFPREVLSLPHHQQAQEN